MNFCVACRVWMRCEKNGAIVEFENRHGYMVDVWKCPRCLCRVALAGSGQKVLHVSDSIRDEAGAYLFQAKN